MSPVISSSGVIHVFWKGQNGNLWQVVRGPSGLWNSPQDLGAGRLGSQPQGAARPDGTIEVFWRGGTGKDMRAAVVGANGHRQGPYVLSGNMPLSAPTVVSTGGLVHVFFTGNDGLLWQVVPTRAGGWGPPPELVASKLQSPPFAARSEEHTSELQSRGHLVCRLLLEKKKTHCMRPSPSKKQSKDKKE